MTRQRSRYTHYYFYIRDEVLGPMVMCVGSFLPLPDTGFGLELVEFTGIERKAAEARTYDPGAAMLVLTVVAEDAEYQTV